MGDHLLTNIGVYIFLIKEKKVSYFHKPNDPIWCALGGRMSEEDSSCEEALLREIREETGIDKLENLKLFSTKLWDINGKNKRLGIFYVSEIKDVEIKLSEEHDEYNFFTYEEAVKMLSLESRGKVGLELMEELLNEGYIE